MQFQSSKIWAVTLFTLLLTSDAAWSQKSPRIDHDWVEKPEALYEDLLNLPDRVAKAKAITLDNEFQENEEGKNSNFYSNPLLLNGLPLEYADFSPFSEGRLTVVEGNPASSAAKSIPFKIYLRRGGKIIHEGASDTKREVTETELSKILSIARDGDHLVIEPARKKDWKAKRILRVPGGC